jgi:hypothetical protein
LATIGAMRLGAKIAHFRAFTRVNFNLSGETTFFVGG